MAGRKPKGVAVMREVRVASRPAEGSARPSTAVYRKLRPGPGRPAAEVASHQRARIQRAMIEIVAEHGYGAVTVRELSRLAGVSTHTFYEHFAGKEECFLSTYERVVRSAARRVLASQMAEGDWQAQLRLGLLAIARELAEEPRVGRLALVEPFAVGPGALERMRRSGGLFETMLRDGFAQGPDKILLPPLLAKGIVAGVAGVARGRLLAGREDELPDLAEELMEWALCFRSAASEEFERPRDPFASMQAAAKLATGEACAERTAPGDERALILSAVAKLAAVADGYRQLTVPRIRTVAGVSRKSFDAHFDDVRDCFLAAFELHTGRAVGHSARMGAATARSWPGGIHCAITALCAYIVREPALARLGFIAPDSDGMRWRARLIARVAEVFRNSASRRQRPGEVAAESSVGAIWTIVRHHIAAGQAQRLPQIAGTLSFLALAPAIGAPAAAETIHAEQARIGSGLESSGSG